MCCTDIWVNIYIYKYIFAHKAMLWIVNTGLCVQMVYKAAPGVERKHLKIHEVVNMQSA